MAFYIFILYIVGLLFLLFLYTTKKKKEFNSINVGDEIFYPEETLCDNCLELPEMDSVEKIEYYEDGKEIKFIHTKNGEKYNLLDYTRDNFMLVKYHLS